MALEKPTRGKPVRERDFIIGKFTAKLRNFQTNLSQPGRENFCLVFRAKQKKSNSDFFSLFFASIFVPVYGLYGLTIWTIQNVPYGLTVQTSKFMPRNLPRKACILPKKPYRMD